MVLQASVESSRAEEAARAAAAAGPSSVTFSADDFPSVSGQGTSGAAPLGTWVGAGSSAGGWLPGLVVGMRDMSNLLIKCHMTGGGAAQKPGGSGCSTARTRSLLRFAWHPYTCTCSRHFGQLSLWHDLMAVSLCRHAKQRHDSWLNYRVLFSQQLLSSPAAPSLPHNRRRRPQPASGRLPCAANNLQEPAPPAAREGTHPCCQAGRSSGTHTRRQPRHGTHACRSSSSSRSWCGQQQWSLPAQPVCWEPGGRWGWGVLCGARVCCCFRLW